MYKLTRREQETIILLNNADEHVEIEAHDPRLRKRLYQLAKLYPADVLIGKSDKYAVNFTFPKGWLRINPPREINLSDEQRAERRERAKRNFTMNTSTTKGATANE